MPLSVLSPPLFCSILQLNDHSTFQHLYTSTFFNCHSTYSWQYANVERMKTLVYHLGSNCQFVNHFAWQVLVHVCKKVKIAGVNEVPPFEINILCSQDFLLLLWSVSVSYETPTYSIVMSPSAIYISIMFLLDRLISQEQTLELLIS